MRYSITIWVDVEAESLEEARDKLRKDLSEADWNKLEVFPRISGFDVHLPPPLDKPR